MIKEIKKTSLYKKIHQFNVFLGQKIIFKKSIEKIKKSWLRKHLLEICALNVIFYKIINLILIATIVLLSGFLMRHSALEWVINDNSLAQKNDSLFQFTLNNGIALGSLNTNSNLVYTLQSLPIILGFLVFIFVSKSWFYIPILFLLFGGLGNIIDRAIPELELIGISPFTNNSSGGGNDIYHGVVDYWIFAKSVINLFDVYIVLSICFVILNMIISYIVSYMNEKKKQDNDQDKISKIAKENDLEVVEVSNKQFGYDDEKNNLQ